MIEIEDPNYFTKVMDFALENNCASKLLERLEYLTSYHEGENTCVLFKDWAPHSFSFYMLRPDGSRWFNGGLIYSGPDQPLDGSFPALTVGIGIDSSKHSWSVHT
jgi:hypothetical protein